jgi:hypothetical protein
MDIPSTPTVQASDIPIFVNNRDRLTSTKTLCDWLLKAGTKKITVLDNDSSYGPLLEWYRSLPDGVEVVRQGNLGPWGAWSTGRLQTQANPYIVTDSDCVPSECCPLDLVDRLLKLLRDNPGCGKVGPGLRLDNIPDLSRDFITNGDGKGWEGEGVFWKRRHSISAFYAPIDTTFAIYNEHSQWVGAGWQNLRMDMPYVVEHTPWYIEKPFSEEEQYYRDHADRTWSHVTWPSPINS